MRADLTTGVGTSELPVGWRFKAGIVLFALSLVPYAVLFPLVFNNVPLKTTGTLVAAGVVLGKALLLSAVMALGKDGFAVLKAKFLHRLTPPAEVGPTRYHIGLVMLCLPFLQNAIESYAGHIAPQLVANRLWVDLLMDAMLVASVFVLGGHFWDKLRALFVVDARAVFPKDLNTAEAAPLVG